MGNNPIGTLIEDILENPAYTGYIWAHLIADVCLYIYLCSGFINPALDWAGVLSILYTIIGAVMIFMSLILAHELDNVYLGRWLMFWPLLLFLMGIRQLMLFKPKKKQKLDFEEELLNKELAELKQHKAQLESIKETAKRISSIKSEIEDLEEVCFRRDKCLE